ncbi:uncharacterized protein EI97DRAFT_462658 [Westerdykella ornata]|uniref:Mid2 domain-containing protein n=1 Tax=Westerdykella ornata TaxID=318751 RepID=A0A6A6J6L4_WESOR|nr:uncharacterized protein EI97DRAFT_462658 [Westerdykella ornata]KAF2271608.1 hypothetical protein EI97DRAFT_462658 [Westerdykella ornata]
MFQYSICAFLAPALVSAAAFPWAGPDPTLVIPEPDNWTPAPTEGPRMGAMELVRRADDSTCGYISGVETDSLTCNDPGYICATNTFYGVHGCCDPAAISTCSLYTSCVNSANMASCTGACLSDDMIAKCTKSSAAFCYEWRYVYASTVMTEHGCASTSWTISAWRTHSNQASRDISDAPNAVTDPTGDSSSVQRLTGLPTISRSSPTTSSAPTSSSSTTSTSTSTPSDTGSKTNVGAIAGGVVGGVVVLAALAFGLVFLVMRNRKKSAASTSTPAAGTPGAPGFAGPAPGVAEYKPQPGGPAGPSPYGSPLPGYAAAPVPPSGGYYGPASEEGKWAHMGNAGAGAPPPPGSPAPPEGIVEAGGNAVQMPQGGYVPPPGSPGPQQVGMQRPPQGNVYEAP